MVSQRNDMICAWSGPIGTSFLGFGLWALANWIPPPSPMLDTETVASMFRENTIKIRLAVFFILLSGGLIIPFFGAISNQMRRMEGDSRSLTYAQLAAATVTILFFVFPALLWVTAAFRPDQPAALIQLVNDFAWLIFVGAFSVPMVQNIVFGIAILSDSRPEKVFPRWSGFYNLWVGFLFIPGGLIIFFKEGPFAWDGLFAWWLPLCTFGSWFWVTWYLLIKAIKKQNIDKQDE